jgi:hypothetical protein
VTNSATIRSAALPVTPQAWEVVNRFNDGDISILVMRQEAAHASHLPRFSFRIGRANGEHISPHIPVFAKLVSSRIESTFPVGRIIALMGQAETWIQSQLVESVR